MKEYLVPKRDRCHIGTEWGSIPAGADWGWTNPGTNHLLYVKVSIKESLAGFFVHVYVDTGNDSLSFSSGPSRTVEALYPAYEWWVRFVSGVAYLSRIDLFKMGFES